MNRMETFFSLLTALSAALTLWLLLVRRREWGGGAEFSQTSILLCIWLVANAVWGTYYLSFRIPGLFDLSIDRMIFVLLSAALIAGIYSGKYPTGSGYAIELLMSAFSCICIVSMIRFGFKPDLPQFPSPWNLFMTGYLFPFLVFAVAKMTVSREYDLVLVFNTLFYFSVYLVALSFLEFFDMRGAIYPRYIADPEILIHLDRARGPFLNSAFNGTAIVMGFASGIHLLTRRSGFGKALHLLLLSLFVPAVFFTQTRSVYLCFLIVLLGLLFFYRTSFPKWKIFSLPLALLLIFAMAGAPKLASEERRAGGVYQVEEVHERIALIRRSVIMFMDRPFFGFGFGRFLPASMAQYRAVVAGPESAEEQVQHNHILGLLVEVGLTGLAIYLSIIVIFFRRLHALASLLPDRGFISRNLVVVIALAAVVFLINGFFVEPAYCLYVNAVFFLLAGITDAIYGRTVPVLNRGHHVHKLLPNAG